MLPVRARRSQGKWRGTPARSVGRWPRDLRTTLLALLRRSVPARRTVAQCESSARSVDALFEPSVCRNCGARRERPWCAECGQGVVGRLSVGDVWREFWQRSRWFESAHLRAVLNLVHGPGNVAREYVLGARKRHVHPLKLLLVVVTLLAWLLSESHYLTAGQDELSREMATLVSWGRWSFTLGLFATFGASLLVYPRRLGTNPTEHLVLATYVQAVILSANAINLLPLLFLDTARWVPCWRTAAGWYMWPIELLILGFAFRQFFLLDLTRAAARVRLGIALATFVIAKKALLLGYGHLIVQFVLRTPSP